MRREDAERERARFEREVEGRGPRLSKNSPADALDRFLRSRVEERAGTEETKRYYRATLGPYFASMGGRPLSGWAPSDATRWIAAHPAWSPRSTAKFLRCLKTFAKWCQAERIDVGDLVGRIRAPRVERREREPLSPPQVRALVDAAEGHDWMRLPVALAAYAGLSLGDCRSLEWPEVDFTRKRIVRPRKKSGRPLNVPLAAPLEAILAPHRAVSGPVCRGMPSSSSAVSKSMRGLYRAAGVPRAKGDGLHWMRTAFVSAGVAAGVDLATMADLIGDNPITVARHYVHSLDSAKAAAVARIADGIAGVRAEPLGASSG